MALIPILEILTKISLSPRTWAQLISAWTSCHTFQWLNPCTESITLCCYPQLNSRTELQSLSLAFWVNCVSLVTYLRSVNCIWPELELELELELTLTKILELELELNPKTVAGIGIGINSIFFGMTKGLPATLVTYREVLSPCSHFSNK